MGKTGWINWVKGQFYLKVKPLKPKPSICFCFQDNLMQFNVKVGFLVQTTEAHKYNLHTYFDSKHYNDSTNFFSQTNVYNSCQSISVLQIQCTALATTVIKIIKTSSLSLLNHCALQNAILHIPGPSEVLSIVLPFIQFCPGKNHLKV